MKRIFYLLMLGVFSTFCQNIPTEEKSDNSTPSNPRELEEQAYSIFQDQPDKAIELLQKAGEIYLEDKNYPKTAITFLNVANIYDEYLEKPDSALLFANQSLSAWQQINETMQIANLYKYKGLLLGKTGAFDLAKLEIEKAINLYETLGFDQGIAVSQFNLANVYFEQNNFTESITLFELATNFWKSQNKQDRVFINNLFGIKLYAKVGNQESVQDLIQQNNLIMPSISLNAKLIDEFEALKKLHGTN